MDRVGEEGSVRPNYMEAYYRQTSIRHQSGNGSYEEKEEVKKNVDIFV